MTAFTESQMAAFAWVYAATLIEPGQFARIDVRDDEATRSRNHACTPTTIWHVAPEFAGINGGETGV